METPSGWLFSLCDRERCPITKSLGPVYELGLLLAPSGNHSQKKNDSRDIVPIVVLNNVREVYVNIISGGLRLGLYVYRPIVLGDPE